MTSNLTPTWNPSDPCEPASSADGRPETAAAHQALLDYLHLGAGRSLPALIKRYQAQETAPTHALGTLGNWSVQFDWPARAAAYDALEDQRQQTRREAILQRGLALEFERIEHLTDLFDRLNALAADEEAFWIKNVRLLSMPDGSVERVELRHFNGALIRNLRGLLNDIASETGGRALRAPLPLIEEPTLKPEDYSLDVLTPEEKAEFFRLQNKIFDTPSGRGAGISDPSYKS